MKKPLLMLVVVLLTASLTGIAYSQETKTQFTPEQRAQKLTDWMKTNLKLTDAQVPQVQAINLSHAQKTEEIKNSTSDQNQKMSALKTDNEEKEKEFKKVFTPEQYSAYEAKKAELKAEMKKYYKEKNG